MITSISQTQLHLSQLVLVQRVDNKNYIPHVSLKLIIGLTLVLLCNEHNNINYPKDNGIHYSNISNTNCNINEPGFTHYLDDNAPHQPPALHTEQSSSTGPNDSNLSLSVLSLICHCHRFFIVANVTP